MFQPDFEPLNEVNKVDVSAVVRKPYLPARPPVGQQRKQVEDADGAVAIEVRWTAGISSPACQ